jgi:nitroreductase
MATLTEKVFREAAEQAGRAPSMHNTQPWRITRADDVIEVSADPDRTLRVADPTGRATRLACGAALLNLRLALWSADWHTQTQVLPDSKRPQLIAQLSPAPGVPMPPGERSLVTAIPRRRSNRAAFFDTPVPATHHAALALAAADASASLILVLDQRTLTDVGELITTADNLLNERPGYVEELRGWLRDEARAADGIPAATAGPAPGLTEPFMRRDFGGRPAQENRRFEAKPLIAVLCSLGDTPRDQITAGQALQRVLLRATSLGLSCSMFSQPIEEPSIRERLRACIGEPAVPQMVLRIGYGTPAPASGRRSVDDIVGVVDSDART